MVAQAVMDYFGTQPSLSCISGKLQRRVRDFGLRREIASPAKRGLDGESEYAVATEPGLRPVLLGPVVGIATSQNARDVILARRGRPARLNLRSEEIASCSGVVVFGDLGRSAKLPKGDETMYRSIGGDG